ncbi:MAG: fluoride efflux transporter CrcB [Bacteroides sp.]
MRTLIYVFLGGGTGSVLRYVCQQVIGQGFVGSFPLGTFFVNIVGSFLIGIFYTLSARFNLSVEMRMLLTVGLCGGFTTFSTFSSDSLNLLKGELYGVFTLYALLSVVIGISFAFAGAWISKNIF